MYWYVLQMYWRQSIYFSQYIIMVLELWMWDDWLCKCVWLVYYTSLMVSSFTMTAMAMERWVSFLSKQESAFVQGERKYYDLDHL